MELDHTTLVHSNARKDKEIPISVKYYTELLPSDENQGQTSSEGHYSELILDKEVLQKSTSGTYYTDIVPQYENCNHKRQLWIENKTGWSKQHGDKPQQEFSAGRMTTKECYRRRKWKIVFAFIIALTVLGLVYLLYFVLFGATGNQDNSKKGIYLLIVAQQCFAFFI